MVKCRTIAPYLFNLKEKFTQYQLYNILAMKSAFSVRIYELVKSYTYQKSKTFKIDELLQNLNIDILIKLIYKLCNHLLCEITQNCLIQKIDV